MSAFNWQQAWIWGLFALLGILVAVAIVGAITRHRFLKKLSKEQQALQVVSDAVQNMLSYTDLNEVVGVVYEQLQAVGLDFHTLTVHHITDAENGQCRAHEMGLSRQVVERTFTSLRIVDMSRIGEVIYRPDMHVDAGGLDPQLLKNMENRMGCPIRAVLDIPHARGLMSLHSARPKSFSGHDIALIKRVGEYVSLGISRGEDILQLREALDAARKLSHAIEHSPASVVITDTQGTIEYVNPQFERVTGYTAKEAIGQNPRILKSGELPDEEYRKLWKIIQKGGVWRGEFHNKRKNGELYWEAASISGVRNQDGEITNFVAVKEDITDKKEMEAALVATERDRVLIETAGAAAHEINQPLTVIMGLVQLLLHTIKDEKVCEDLGYVEQAGQEIKKIVAKMAQTNRYESKSYVGEAHIVQFASAKQDD